MRVKVELDLKVEMWGGAKHDGTGKQGDMPDGTRYKDLCEIFEKPEDMRGYGFDKTKVEWIGKINGLLFTIYDYKSDKEPEQNTDWHIGAKKKIAADLLIAYFKEKLYEMKKDSEMGA